MQSFFGEALADVAHGLGVDFEGVGDGGVGFAFVGAEEDACACEGACFGVSLAEQGVEVVAFFIVQSDAIVFLFARGMVRPCTVSRRKDTS